MEDRTPEAEALTALILEVFRANGAMLEAGNRITKPYGLTSARWQVMGAIDLAGHAMTVAQIARRMGLTRQSVQRIVNDLAKLGMIVMETNPDHKRAALVAISEEGSRVMVKIDRAQIAWVNKLSDGLGAEQLGQASTLLQTVRDRSHELNA